MIRRNLWLSGLGLLLVGGIGLARTAAVETPGTRPVSDEVAGALCGGDYCPKLIRNPGANCTKCTTMYFYTPDPNGTYVNRMCYNFCVSGGMNCNATCDACEVLIPCDHPLCAAAGACP